MDVKQKSKDSFSAHNCLNNQTSQIKEECHSPDRALLARYNIVLKETIGEGSYSKVKEAYDFKNSRRIAVKIIDFKKTSKDFREKFLPREIEIWPKIIHPNIIMMHQLIMSSEKIYMLLEFAFGGDMLTYMQIKGAISETESKHWMKQICSAVEFLHNRKISHRDLKLENLLIDSDNNIKLSDFGFSKDISMKDKLSETYCGSRAYASPEILIGQPYDPKKAGNLRRKLSLCLMFNLKISLKDVWALGVILYIFLTGNMPFDEQKCNQIILNEHWMMKIFFIKNLHLTSAVKNLLKFIFTFEWISRPNVAEIMSNEWFNKCDTNQYHVSSKTKRKLISK